MIHLDHRDRQPLYLQIVSQIEDLALHGVLKPDQQLPSLRNLAVDLSINPNTIQRAYLELETKGIIYSVPGKGSFISPNRDRLFADKKDALYKNLAALIKLAIALQIEKDAFLSACENLYMNMKEGDIR